MASVAICPHCYLQLVVPDGVEPDERVECPTCAKEFGLDQAVIRAIPEVVRRPLSTVEPAPIEEAAESTEEIVAEIDEIIEVDEVVIESAGESEPESIEAGSEEVIDEIEQIKDRIEAEIAAHGLQPGTSMHLPFEPPADDADSTFDATENVESADEDPEALFRNAKTVAEIPELELGDLSLDLDFTEESAADAETQASDEVPATEGLHDDVVDELDELEPLESRLTKPTVRTLAELMPPREEQAEVEDEPGPSFDLPNVALTPNNGATVEIDPSMMFGPAAETEFELDNVDFDSSPVAESTVDEVAEEETAEEYVAEEETAEASEPVFREPGAAELPAAPFVLPGVPRARKKRSAVRVLVGIAAGGVLGTIGAIYALLYLLGPEGDLLQVAQYLPSAVLPKSFQATTDRVVAAPNPAVESPESTASVEPPAADESANVPAGYVEETVAPAALATTVEPAADDRYDTEPSPLTEEPAAEPIADDKPALPAAQLLHGPLFTIEQLATALEAGKTAQERLMTGDLSDESVRRTKGMSYAKLCDLAEALTFVDRADPSIESEDAIDGADRLFRETLADPHTRDEVAKIAPIWINSPHRGHGGVFLAGSVSGGQIEGDVYQYELAFDGDKQLALLMPEPLDSVVESSGHPVGIVGSIVDNPADQISGYTGTAERVIWVTRAIPLD